MIDSAEPVSRSIFSGFSFAFRSTQISLLLRFAYIVYLCLMYFQNLFIALHFPAVTQCLTAKLLERDSNSSSVCQIISGYNEVDDEGTFSLKYMIHSGAPNEHRHIRRARFLDNKS